MVATFSPHRDAGGTLHLPSPTGMHHVDASSAIRQLRRSLSRSPSKSSDFRLLPSRTHVQTSSTPFFSSPLSPSRRVHQGNLFLVPTTSNSSSTPVAIPHSPSAKISKPAMRRTGSLQTTRTRTSPKSPSKRALNISSDQGNATPAPPSVIPSGEENIIAKAVAEAEENGPSPPEPVLAPSEDTSLAPKPARVEKRRSGNLGSISSTVSPLKRSDGIMNLDQASFESPSAKRRSLHGASSTSDFNIFDSTDGGQNGSEPLDGSTRDNDAQNSAIPQSPAASPFATIPRRTSSLRRSTLQQRQSDRSFLTRSRLLNAENSESPPASPVMRHRMSLDSSLSIASGRESPFSSSAPFSSGGNSLFSNQNGVAATPHAAHPLSRTITQSSSSPSVADDSPTHEPIHKGERPRPVFNFSKSLPAGATRPGAGRPFTRTDSNSSSESFATPENYKLVKPLPAAFMSTGLISKKNRNAESLQNPSGLGKNMPDTPCKKSTNLFPTAQKALPVRPIEKPKLVRQSLGTPSTPFTSQEPRPTPGPFARGTGIFGSAFNRPGSSRRDSFVSIDGDERSLSPSVRHDNQSITDCELPPTPTKQTFTTSHGPFSLGSGTLQVASLDGQSEPQVSTRKYPSTKAD